jgi:acetyl-CoA synthetase
MTALERYWDKEAHQLPWFTKWQQVLDWQEPYARWFIGGTLNASYICLDQHIHAGFGQQVALYVHNEFGIPYQVTYEQLYILVNKLAYIFQQAGISKGDVVIVYMPMIPEAIAAVLALARLGAVHAVVFSGFSAHALADRISDARARFIITADWTMRRGKKIDLKQRVDTALEQLTHTIAAVLLCDRSEPSESSILISERTIFLSQKIAELSDDTYVAPVAVESNHLLYILYTSGTTGKPKGIMHGTGGYLTYIYSVFKYVFDVKKTDVYWCTADIGWVTGHSFVAYAPLMHGLSIVLYEGAPDFPTEYIWWDIIDKYRVTIFYTSPTALRMFMRTDQNIIGAHDFTSLRALGSVGEPINPEVWHWFSKTIGRDRCPVIDTWWQTETGGFMISPTVWQDKSWLKPGSAGRPLPSIQAEIVDESGRCVPVETQGFLVIRQPWPGLTQGVYRDPERFKQTYWSRFAHSYYTGDYARQDSDGNFWLLGRADEVLSLAGHRIGTAEIESAAITHIHVVEAAAIGIPDALTGEAVVIFVVLRDERDQTIEHTKKEIINTVRAHIGNFVTPREIYCVEKLPKTRSGKIMRRILKALALGEEIGDISTLEDEEAVTEARISIEK